MDGKLNHRVWFDLHGAAEYLGISEGTLRLAIERNQLKYTRTRWKVRHKFMFHRAWLDLYLLEHKNQMTYWKSVRIKLANWFLPKVPETE